MSIPVINFPPFRPYSNITPFTVRDGATYLTVLEELRNWLNTTLVPHVDTEIANLVIAWEDNASTLLANVIAALNEQSDTVTAQLNEQNASILQQLNDQNAAITAQLAAQDADVAAQIDAMTTYVDNAVQSIINSTIEVSDPVMTGIASNKETDYYAVSKEHFGSKPDITIMVAPRTGSDAADGLTWDDAKISLTSAIAALPATGGKILVGGGSITESEIEITKSNVSIVAVGYDTSIDVSASSMANAIYAIGKNAIVIDGFRIIGSGEGSQPINVTDGSPITGANLANSGCGIILAGCSNSVIRNNIIENCGGTTGTGINNGVAGIWLTRGCSNCDVSGNKVINCRNGINEDNYYAVNPHGNKIIKNWVYGCRFGIALDSESASTGSSITYSTTYPVAYDTLVDGNTIVNCQQSGIDLNKARRAKIVNNYIENCGLENLNGSANNGIHVYGTASNYAIDVLITGNTILRNGVAGATGGHGIKMSTFAYNIIIAENLIAGNNGNGVFGQGAIRNAIIKGNEIVENNGDGIAFDGTITNGNVGTNKIIENSVRTNNGHGIVGKTVYHCVIANNIVRGNGAAAPNTKDGIRLEASSSRNIITGNHVYGASHRFSFACIDSSSVQNTIDGNDFGEAFDTSAGVGTEYGTARCGFGGGAEQAQHWGNNHDSLKTTDGLPDGAWAVGAKVFNSYSNKLFIKAISGWRELTLTIPA